MLTEYAWHLNTLWKSRIKGVLPISNVDFPIWKYTYMYHPRPSYKEFVDLILELTMFLKFIRNYTCTLNEDDNIAASSSSGIENTLPHINYNLWFSRPCSVQCVYFSTIERSYNVPIPQFINSLDLYTAWLMSDVLPKPWASWGYNGRIIKLVWSPVWRSPLLNTTVQSAGFMIESLHKFAMWPV